MTYRVVWHRNALRQLARIWSATAQRTSIARAANFIERLLMIDPGNEGTPLRRGMRRLFVTPLFAEYSIDELNRTETILRVRLTP